MAISLKTAGTWETASNNATSYQFAIPTHAANDLLLLRAFIKPSNGTTPSTISPSIDQDWSIIASGYTYSNNSGNGSGSLYAVVAWKKALSSSETGPTLSFGTSTSPAEGVVTVFQRGATENWITPVAIYLGYTTTTSISVTLGSNPGVTAGDMCVVGIGHADNDDLTSPTFTQSGVTFGTAVVEPTTPNSSSNGNDIAGTGVYRLASSGTASAAPAVTATASSSMEGIVSFTRLRVLVSTEATVQAAAAGTGAANGDTAKIGAVSGAGAATGEALDADGLPAALSTTVLAEATGAAADVTGTVVATVGAGAATGDTAAALAALAVPLGYGDATAEALDATADVEEGQVVFTCEAAAEGTGVAILVNANLTASAGYAKARSA